MEPPKVTPWEKELSPLWKAILRDEAPPRRPKPTGEAGLNAKFSADGLIWLKQALGEGIVWWLVQGATPLPVGEISRIPLSFTPRSVEVLSHLFDQAEGRIAQRDSPAATSNAMLANGDLLVETIAGAWLRDWQSARFAPMAERLRSQAVALIGLLSLEPLPWGTHPITWDEDLLVLLSPRLALAWEQRWRRFHERLSSARFPGPIADLGRLTQLLVSYWGFARGRKRLDFLCARLVRLCATTLTTMKASDAFSSEIDWQTMTVIDRQALKRSSHPSFALGLLLEADFHQARRTGYLSEEYERAQEVLKMHTSVSDLPWLSSLQAIKQDWSSDIAGSGAHGVAPTSTESLASS